jgi:uncharacterized protein (DUF983 family)
MTRSSRISAVLGQRCPRCLRGKMFRGSFAMNEACPACGLTFEREPGYFMGAMYFSYPLAVPLVALLTLSVQFLRPSWPLEGALAVSFVLTIPFVPLIFRCARTLWIYFDRAVHGS